MPALRRDLESGPARESHDRPLAAMSHLPEG
jgi:hypothetical protein